MPGRPTGFAVCAVAITVLAAACGSTRSNRTAPSSVPAATTTTIAARTVEVTMADLKYSVAQIDVRVGETVRFVFHNQDKVVHEAVLGDAAAQVAHEQEMATMGSGNMAGMNMNGPDEVSVDPGATGEFVHSFKAAGPLIIGCHEPGHYAAGMKITVNVT